MALTPEQQALEHITRAKRILITTCEHPSNDALAAASACVLFLKKMGKEADVFAPGHDPKTTPAFLPGRDRIQTILGAMRAFTITLDVKDVPLEELLYNVRDKKLEITIVPKHGEWQPKDVTFRHGDDRYDLVIALDAPDMQSLGSLAREQANFLYRTTIINIDRNATNERWGQINLLDLNAVSTTEILLTHFEAWNRHAIDEDIATALLTGMIAKTHSFRTSNVTPKTLSAAAQLVAMGARREEIVHGLWRTRTVPVLKLWGRALSRLEHDRDTGLVWSTVTRQDLIDTGTSEESIKDVIHELLAYAPDAKVVTLFCESASGESSRVIIHVTAPHNALEIGRPLGAKGTHDRAEARMADGSAFQKNVDIALHHVRTALAPGKGAA